MKKLVLSFLVLFFVSGAGAEVAIFEDFYINGGEVIGRDSVLVKNILPNALRVCICEGEQYRLSADVLPENAVGAKLFWRIKDGFSSVAIRTEGNTCTVSAKEAGFAKISVSASGGASAEIDIEVTPQKKTVIQSPSLLPEREEKKTAENEGAVTFIVRLLVVMSLGLFLAAAIMLLIKRREGK